MQAVSRKYKVKYVFPPVLPSVYNVTPVRTPPKVLSSTFSLDKVHFRAHRAVKAVQRIKIIFDKYQGGIILIQIELVVPKIITFPSSGPCDWFPKVRRVIFDTRRSRNFGLQLLIVDASRATTFYSCAGGRDKVFL